MKLRFPLAARIVLLAIGNFLLLGLVFAAYVRLQLSTDMKSFLMTAARERIIGISRQIALDLEDAPGEDRDRLLRRYAVEYGVTFYLFLNSGEQMAGDRVTLPPAVLTRMRERGPRDPNPIRPPGEDDLPEDRRGPPPREEDPDPGPPEGRKRAGPPPRPPRGIPAGDPFLVETSAAPRYWVGVRMPVPDRLSPRPMHGTLLIASSSLWTNSFFFQITPWLVMGGVASLISVLCWLPFIRSTTHAVHRMLAATATIATGRFKVDAGVGRRDELGELGASINRMAAQLDSLVRGQKRFLADAAHELRSPLGRMQLAAGILERNAIDTETEYIAKYVADLKEDVEIMSDLTDELLTFARAESIPAARMVAVPIGLLLERAVRNEKIEGVDIRIEVNGDLQVSADETTLGRSVANIVRNSIRYAGDAGPILLSAKAVDGDIEITIADCGPGVPEESLEKIFTPFYRLDESRNRRTGGAGLGLAIVKSCMESCGGTVVCRNRTPSGLETILRLKKA